MAKTVFDNRMVAHVWAHQTQPEGRSANGQFYFRDSTIYSYGSHFPIARIAHGKNAARYVLFTTRDYSMTTSKHKSYTRHALSGAFPIFYVRDPSSQNVRAEFEEAIANRLKAAAAEQSGKRRGRDKRAIAATAEAAGLAERANEFAAYTGEKWRLKAPAVDLATVEKFAQAESRANAKRAKAAAIKAAKEAERQLELQSEWFTGGNPYGLARFDAPCGGAALRVVGDELQTSHGARVPLDHAVKAFRFLKLVKERGEGWQHNGHSLRVGHFTVDRIEPSGDFVAGCHSFAWPEVERVARLAGVYGESASADALTPTPLAAE